MANPQIKIKRSSVAGKIPTADQLPLGELAANTYDGKLFASKNVGIGTTVFTVNPWTVGVGTNTYNTYFTEGNVGIGNTLPTSKLSVIGDASISGILTADQLYTSNNGNGTNIRIGDDLWLGDINVANTIRLSGAQNSDRAFIVFGNADTVALGRTSSGALYYGGDFTVAGVVTATTFNGTTINATTGNIVTGVITNVQGTNINYSGIATVGSLNIGATQVISSGRQLQNIASLDATTTATIESAIAAAPNNFNDLNVTGISTFTNGPVLIGSGTSTGTVSQRLQVTGGGYVSGNLGVGNANPSSLLTVQGDVLIVGLATANSFRARGGSPGGLGANNNGYGFFGSGDNDSGMYSSADGQVEFYSNSQEAARFTSNQNFLIGSVTETGTASQRLQVTGGAYVSGNFGVNNTNPTSRLSVTGDGNFSGVVTATTFNGQVNAGVGTITTLSGTTASYGTINVTTGNIVTGVITNAQGTNINYSGIGTITTLNTTNSSAINRTGTNLNITGIGTVNSLNIGATQVISSARQLQNIASLDATTTATIEAAVSNAPNTFTDLQVTGISTFTNGPVLIGSGTSTGTASQRLQVTGGGYISGNLGINTTNPTENLSVLGKIQIQQDSSSNNRLIFRGQPSSLFRWSIDNFGSANDFRIFKEDDATAANGVVYLGISTGGNVTATTFSGTTVNATTGNIVTGIITNAQGTNLNYSGIGTIGTLNSIISVITNIQGTNLNYSGIGTVATLNSTAGTITTLNGTTASYTTGNIVTGIITNAQGTNLNYSGISTLGSVLSGNINSSGVVTATSFVGSGANLTSLNATQLTSGIVPGARITSSGGDFTVGANLYVNGVLSVGGTSIILNAAQLKINDRDITLGVTTDALGNDISNDNTANHGGISVASTIGTPLINIPVDAANNDLSTYKQIMWVKQGHYSGFATDAWILNYGVSIGNTATVQNGSRLTVGAGFTVYENYVDLQSLRSVNISNSGITTLSGGLNASQGADLSRLRVVGITTLGQVNVIGLSNAGISTLGNATADTLVVAGFSTLGAISGSLLSISGVSTLSGGISAIQGIDAARLRIAGITTLGQTNIAGLSNAGVSTLGNATASTLNVSGISTLSTVSLTAVDVTSTTTTTTTTAATAIVSISASSYRSAVFQIQAVEGTNYNMTTINVLHDGIETYMTEYGTINQPVGIATFGTDISGGSLRLLAYPASINSTTFKVAVTALDI